MQMHNVNRHLDAPAPSAADDVFARLDRSAEERHEHEMPGTGPWLQISQLDLFCSGCAGRTWSHDCWSAA